MKGCVLASITSSIASIKVQFTHSVTGQKITLSPDDIFKKITDFVVLLPEDITNWILSLAKGFFQALSPEM